MDLDTCVWLTKWFLAILVSGLIMVGIALDMRKSRETHNSNANDISQEEYDRMSAKVDSMSATLARTLAWMEEIERAMNQPEKENDTDDDMSQQTPDTRSVEIDRMQAKMKEMEESSVGPGKVLVMVGCRGEGSCAAWRFPGEAHNLTEAEEDERIEKARQATENRKTYQESAAYLDNCVTVVDPDVERIVVGNEIYVVGHKVIRQTGHRIDDEMVHKLYYRGAVFEKLEPGSCGTQAVQRTPGCHALRGAWLRDIEITGDRIAALKKQRTEPGSTVYVTEWIDPHPERHWRHSRHRSGVWWF